MINVAKSLTGNITEREKIVGIVNTNTVKIYPELENIEITPSGIEQFFKSEGYYGYDEITVKAVASDTIDIIPMEESQHITGLFGIVNVDGIPNEYKKVNVEDETLILSRVSVTGEELIV